MILIFVSFVSSNSLYIERPLLVQIFDNNDYMKMLQNSLYIVQDLKKRLTELIISKKMCIKYGNLSGIISYTYAEISFNRL